MVKRIGIIGLGVVGSEVVKSLMRHSSLIQRRSSVKIELAGLCDFKKQKSKIASRFGLPFTKDPYKLINDPSIDIIVELIGGFNPASDYIFSALKKGKHVVTANKALLAQKGKEIFSLAAKKDRIVGFEASVCGAIPLIKSISEGLVACDVTKLYGILNGTTNYILTRMEKDQIDFGPALKEARINGFAERNASMDIKGKDTLHKLCILSYLCFGIWPNIDKVYTEGISKISLQDIVYASHMNYRIKLLAIAKKEAGKLDLRVHPTLVSEDHPLSETSLAFNSVYLDTHPAGELLFYGKGAGGEPTSSAVISDIVDISLYGKGISRREQKVVMKKFKDTLNRYYIRFMTQDKPGVLAHVAKILASNKISIASVSQKARGSRKLVPIVMVTHEAKEESVKRALAKIDQLSVISSPPRLIRMESL